MAPGDTTVGRTPNSSRKVSAVLARRVDSEVPRSKGARSTFSVSVCESSCVIGGLRGGLPSADYLAPPPLRVGYFISGLVYSNK